MDQQIIDNNKLIAEFMNYKHDGKPMAYMTINYKKLYHTDWNWLMPVAHKCLTICRDKMKTEWESVFSDIFLTCSIESMQKEIVEFINWYNKQRK